MMKRLWCTGAGLLVLLSGCCSTGALTVADGELMVEEESCGHEICGQGGISGSGNGGS